MLGTAGEAGDGALSIFGGKFHENSSLCGQQREEARVLMYILADFKAMLCSSPCELSVHGSREKSQLRQIHLQIKALY